MSNESAVLPRVVDEMNEQLSSTAVMPTTDDQFEQMLPRPVGYHLLIALPDVETTCGDAGLIIKPHRTIEQEAVATMIGLVIDMGEQAYQDPKRFPTGPWCKKGDYVLFRPYSGTRFRMAGKEWRLINDDTVEAVVVDPKGIERA